MNNMLKEFKELLFNSTLFKVHNQVLGNKTPNGMNGGKPFKNLQRSTNRSKKTWK
jgi:hypothetical protein